MTPNIYIKMIKNKKPIRISNRKLFTFLIWIKDINYIIDMMCVVNLEFLLNVLFFTYLIVASSNGHSQDFFPTFNRDIL